MRNQTSKTTICFVALSMLLLAGCQSVTDDLKSAVTRDRKPDREMGDPSGAKVAVPDLDERKEDTQYLSKIDRLTHEVFDLRSKLKKAETERDSAVKIRNSAQQNEAALADLIDEYKGSLESASDRETKLKDKLLRTELKSVRYQQAIADLKIRELTKGEGK